MKTKYKLFAITFNFASFNREQKSKSANAINLMKEASIDEKDSINYKF